jgi:subtilisin family serine protease
VVSSSASYDFTEDGGGVTAYVLDSGVNATHPEFGGRVKEGWSYRGSSTALASYQSALATGSPNGIAECPNDGSHAVDPGIFDNPSTVDTADKGMTDNDGHGTHVAGIIGGDTTGVAKSVTIVPVRTLDSCGSGTRTMILEALAWILDRHVAGEKAVLNLSIGFDSQVTSVDNAVTALMNKGIVVIAAAGNEATSACSNTPASTLGTISVGSSTIADTESNFSNYGLCVDMFSPGSSIKSAYPFLSGVTNTYATQSGTSMAAPFVAGAVARYLQVLDVAPTNLATGPTTAWTWLRDNVTLNAITPFNISRSPQTENRLLYVPASPVRVEQLVVTPGVNSAVVSWQNAQPNTTYVVRATPGNATCTVIAVSSCTITGLVGGTSYVISTVATSVNGKGAAGSTVTPLASPPPVVVPPPATPSGTGVTVTSKAVSLSWGSVTSSLPVTYVVTNSLGVTVCTTTATGCVVEGLVNGKEYSFAVAAQTSSGMSEASSRIVARPGFTVLKTVVSRKSKTLLSTFVRTVSTGTKTWSESGPCTIKASRLVAPSKKGSCVITLKVAKTKKYPAMSTRVTISIK